MKSLDEMSANDVIAFYYEKQGAMRQGNFLKLIELRKICPDLFNKEKEAKLREMINYIKAFQNTPRYKELRKLDLKKKLFIVPKDHVTDTSPDTSA